MKITVSSGRVPAGTDLIAVGVFAGKTAGRGTRPATDAVWKKLLPKESFTAIELGDFDGKAESRQLVHLRGKTPAPRLLLVGLGARGEVTGETLRRFAGIAGSVAAETTGKRVTVLLPQAPSKLSRSDRARVVGEGLCLGAYRFRRYRSDSGGGRIKAATVLLPDAKELAAARRASRDGGHVAAGVNLCRDLGNTPGNDLGPKELAAWARKEARGAGLRVKVLDEKVIAREGMGALESVARGSARPPRFIVLEHGNLPRGRSQTRTRPLVFVGKAVTFDTGGISLKQPQGMQDMKFDMCGGAAVIGALAAIGRLAPKRPVVGLIPCAENMPGSRASRPGDIVTSAAGLTIEIINTDAEGRLILADALHYAKRYDPELVVDVATLTGACVVALGAVNAGIFTGSPEIADRIRSAAERGGEKMWPMPLDPEYFPLMKSDVADVKNSGGRAAGAITAATFLARFIEGHPWAHLDIAGTGWTAKNGPYHRKGATGSAVRTLVELALER